ncbi:MAG TPA: hypothetical protein VF520_04455 [Thermoleophilaceae bacterium]
MTIDLSGSAFDTTLAAYTGSAVDALTKLGSDDDSGDGLTSRLSIQVTQGETYSFAVDTYGGGRGSIQVALSHVPTEPAAPLAAGAEESWIAPDEPEAPAGTAASAAPAPPREVGPAHALRDGAKRLGRRGRAEPGDAAPLGRATAS